MSTYYKYIKYKKNYLKAKYGGAEFLLQSPRNTAMTTTPESRTPPNLVVFLIKKGMVDKKKQIIHVKIIEKADIDLCEELDLDINTVNGLIEIIEEKIPEDKIIDKIMKINHCPERPLAFTFDNKPVDVIYLYLKNPKIKCFTQITCVESQVNKNDEFLIILK